MKTMAIDYGDAHTGIAISDLTGTLAGFSTTIHSRNRDEVVRRICEIIREHGVEELILGYPKNMDGTLGPRAEKCAAFGETLKEMTSGQDNKTVYVPYEASGVLGSIGSIKELFKQ